MSGPYVVPAYKSKVFGGVEASMSLVSKIFLSGFAATAIVSTLWYGLGPLCMLLGNKSFEYIILGELCIYIYITCCSLHSFLRIIIILYSMHTVWPKHRPGHRQVRSQGWHYRICSSVFTGMRQYQIQYPLDALCRPGRRRMCPVAPVLGTRGMGGR